MLRVTLKGLLEHKIRFILTTFAVVVGVAFVVGAFTLTDSVRAQFDKLFEEINAGIDLAVRGEETFDTGAFGARPPVDESLLPQVQAVPGVAEAIGFAGGLPALLVGADGEAVEPTGGPPLAVSWNDSEALQTLTLKEGRGPAAAGEVAIDIDTVERGDVGIGDTVTIQTPAGPGQFQLVGTFSFGSSNALSGATLTAFTLPETQRLYNLEGKYQEIDIAVADDADRDQVAERIRPLLPPGTEVVTGETLVEESQDAVGEFVDIFGNVLLGFGGVVLFVGAFLISNTFTIVVGQRVRELALLRAVGASARQVAGSVFGEALVVGVLASVFGFVLGLGIALLLNAVLSAAGFGAGDTSLVITTRTVVAAVVVGIVVTLLSAISPARKATTIPPVAAMREGFSLQGTTFARRAIGGVVMILVGSVLLTYALFGDPDTLVLVGGMIVGAVLVFLGVALLSPTVAPPMARFVGAPLARLYRTPGRLAEENAARTPRRTASTASALMIGLALVSTALVVGTSIKESVADTISGSIRADWYLDSGGFFGFSTDIADQMAELPELSAVSGIRFGQFQVEGSTKQANAVDFAVVDELFDLDVREGSFGPGAEGLAVGKDPAADLDLAPGDVVTVVFPETGAQEVPVVAVYEDTSVLGNWALDLGTFSRNYTTENLDVIVAATSAEGASPEEVRAAIETVTAPYPQIEIKDRAEFAQSREDQINQFLVVINVFLIFAVLIAFIGITNTLALSVFERTRELGLLRAVGMGRTQVRRMVRLEAVIVAVFGALLGVAVGMVFGVAVTISLPNDLVSTLAVPWGSLVIVVVVAGLVGVLAALWPAWRAGRLNVLDAIASE
jgi:putative ABC transport system permease protein